MGTNPCRGEGLETSAASPMGAPHRGRKSRTAAAGRGGASRLPVQLDELSPGLLKSPLSRCP